MKIVLLLIIVSIIVALSFLGLFIWAVRNGQFEDTFTPALRMLFEEKTKQEENHPSRKTL